MNIFILSWNIHKCAQLYCDQHVVKILLEICQMLYTAHWHHSPDGWVDNAPLTKNGQRGYKKASENHPMTMWVRTSVENYKWAASLGMALAVEHNHRFGTVHGCSQHISWLYNNVPPTMHCSNSKTAVYSKDGFPSRVTAPPECMPIEYHHPNIVSAYHNYYKGSKLGFARWTNREMGL